MIIVQVSRVLKTNMYQNRVEELKPEIFGEFSVQCRQRCVRTAKGQKAVMFMAQKRDDRVVHVQ